MKPTSLLIVLVVLAMANPAFAETVHQSLPGEKATAGDGSSAVSQKLLEVKDNQAASSGKVARVTGDVPQWSFVTYWFGIPTPAGKSTVRLRVLVDEEPASFAIYIRPASGGQQMVGKIKLPEDAQAGTFVDVDIAVDSKEEWSGAVVKKTEKSDKPGPWIDTISVVLQ